MYVPKQLSKPNNDLPGAQVYNDERLTLRARIVYGVLTKYCDANRTCTVSHRVLMNEFKGSKSMITRAVAQLEEFGVITRRRGSREVCYRLLK
jgi:hypothetical protein